MFSSSNLKEEFTKTLRIVPDYPKKGIMFQDIVPIFMQPLLCSRVTDHLKQSIQNLQIDAIAGLETRGYLFGFALAQAVNLPFIIIRKAGKLPGEVIKKKYELEYGTAAIELQKGLVKPGSKVLIHDDLLATGGTAKAAAELLLEVKAEVVGFLFLIELKDLKGKEKLEKISNNIISFVEL